MLRIRVITALAGIPVIVVAVLAGGWWFLAAAVIIGVIAGWEFDRMVKIKGYAPNQPLLLGMIVLLLLTAFWSLNLSTYVVTAALVLSLFWQLFRAGSKTPTVDWALTLAGIIYIGWSLAHLVALRQLPQGQAWVWLALLATWGGDSFAYLAGSRWGRHKIWPRLSPKKSWEGLLGSFAGGLLLAALVIFWFELSWNPTLLAGAVIPIVAFFGDVAESMLKRDAGIKDTSNLLPGHGGILDRIDSLLFVAGLVYYWAVWLG